MHKRSGHSLLNWRVFAGWRLYLLALPCKLLLRIYQLNPHDLFDRHLLCLGRVHLHSFDDRVVFVGPSQRLNLHFHFFERVLHRYNQI